MFNLACSDSCPCCKAKTFNKDLKPQQNCWQLLETVEPELTGNVGWLSDQLILILTKSHSGIRSRCPWRIISRGSLSAYFGPFIAWTRGKSQIGLNIINWRPSECLQYMPRSFRVILQYLSKYSEKNSRKLAPILWQLCWGGDNFDWWTFESGLDFELTVASSKKGIDSHVKQCNESKETLISCLERVRLRTQSLLSAPSFVTLTSQSSVIFINLDLKSDLVCFWTVSLIFARNY